MSKDLKQKYEEIYASDEEFFFDEGYEEGNMLLNVGWPWKGKRVLEIGCGEGDLASMISSRGAYVEAIDASLEAINRAKKLYPEVARRDLYFDCVDYRDYKGLFDVLVMQGVLEHLDNPFKELQWMLDSFQPKEIVTSSPCFLNPRGYVWMTLVTLFQAPMSLTDKHFLHPWQFDKFARDNELHAIMQTCEKSWGNGPKMLEDLKQRLPKVFQDMKDTTPLTGRLSDLFKFLEGHYKFLEQQQEEFLGAVAVYKLTKLPQNRP